MQCCSLETILLHAYPESGVEKRVTGRFWVLTTRVSRQANPIPKPNEKQVSDFDDVFCTSKGADYILNLTPEQPKNSVKRVDLRHPQRLRTKRKTAFFKR